jgi:hypothetical protein
VFTVALRVPGWAEGHPVPSDLYHYLGDRSPHVRVTINGEALPLQVERGFLHIHRLWKKGDSFRLNLDMLPRWVVARHEVGDDRGRVALERGPIVFCLEGPDNREGHVLDLVLKDSVPLQADFSRDVLGGVQVISGQADAVQRELDGGLSLVRNVGFRAIPYYAWAHRGPSEMTVWPARKVDAARPLPAPTLARRATLKTSGGQGSEALTDQLIPRSSHDHSLPYFHWWPKKGTLEWLEYDLGAKTNVSSVQVYWYDDTGRGECRVPKSWRVLIHTGEEWVPVRGASSFTTEKDRMNRVTFDPVETDRVKLEIQLREGASAGLYEWSLQ